MARVLITGSRESSDVMLEKAQEVIEWVQAQGHVVIVGDARGIDAEVRKTCHLLHVAVAVYGAYNKIRGCCYPGEEYHTISGDYLTRDRVMAKLCDLCVGIWNGIEPSGSAATMRYARRMGKRVYERKFVG